VACHTVIIVQKPRPLKVKFKEIVELVEEPLQLEVLLLMEARITTPIALCATCAELKSIILPSMI